MGLKELDQKIKYCVCGKTFKPKVKGQEFCSEECELSHLEELQDISEILWYIEEL